VVEESWWGYVTTTTTKSMASRPSKVVAFVCRRCLNFTSSLPALRPISSAVPVRCESGAYTMRQHMCKPETGNHKPEPPCPPLCSLWLDVQRAPEPGKSNSNDIQTQPKNLLFRAQNLFILNYFPSFLPSLNDLHEFRRKNFCLAYAPSGLPAPVRMTVIAAQTALFPKSAQPDRGALPSPHDIS
jgi:hypothetical protein